jgi:polyphosphate kinase
MPRNLFERCEVVFPVKDKAAKARIQDEILSAYLADTAKARLMQEDGSYVRARGHGGFSAQEFLMRLAEGKVELADLAKVNGAPAEKTKAPKPEPVAAPK